MGDKFGYCQECIDSNADYRDVSESVAEEVSDYENLTYPEKSKDQLIGFYVVVISLTLVIDPMSVIGITSSDRVIDMVVFIMLIPFIYRNHRWAMVGACGLYILGKVILLVLAAKNETGRFFLVHIIFSWYLIKGTFHAVSVATELKWAEMSESNKQRAEIKNS